MSQLPDLPNWPLHLVEERFNTAFHGDFTKWQAAINALPKESDCRVHIDDVVHLDFPQPNELATTLMQLHPWRKGPFKFAETHIDTEWRSDWKWRRMRDALVLSNHRVLDVGCGNGYFGWRMLAAGAREVVGIDPTVLFCMQHRAVQHFAHHPNHWVLPLGIEEIPVERLFDSVFSMGVIYHRRSPTEHIETLTGLLNPGGQLILESIVVDGKTGFKPKDRYARMRNVWWIPTVSEMEDWLRAAGLQRVECLDVSPTTEQEQRTTNWMTFESYRESLDPNDPEKTVEGYPAPKRAVMLAHLPS